MTCAPAPTVVPSAGRTHFKPPMSRLPMDESSLHHAPPYSVARAAAIEVLCAHRRAASFGGHVHAAGVLIQRAMQIARAGFALLPGSFPAVVHQTLEEFVNEITQRGDSQEL